MDERFQVKNNKKNHLSLLKENGLTKEKEVEKKGG